MLKFDTLIVTSTGFTWEADDVLVGAGSVLSATGNRPISVGRGVRIGHHVIVSEGVVLGDRVKLDSQSYIGPGTSIGEGSEVHGVRVHRDVSIGRNSFVGGEVSNWTEIGDEVTFMGRIVHTYRQPGGAENWRHSPPQPSPKVRDRAVVGEAALLIGGVEIGEGAYVAAGEIVTVSVPPRHIAIRGQVLPLSEFRGFIRSRD